MCLQFTLLCGAVFVPLLLLAAFAAVMMIREMDGETKIRNSTPTRAPTQEQIQRLLAKKIKAEALAAEAKQATDAKATKPDSANKQNAANANTKGDGKVRSRKR